MRLTLCLEGNGEGRVLTSIDIEEIIAHTNIKDTIKEIHDNIANEMYCKGIDDFLTEICKMIVQSESNGNYRFYAVEIKQSIADLAEQLKAGVENERY